MRRAIAANLSSRMGLAVINGPCRHSAGTTGAQIRAEQMRPGTSTTGIASVIGISPGTRTWIRVHLAANLEAWPVLSNQRPDRRADLLYSRPALAHLLGL